jgi:hypothetical protein
MRAICKRSHAVMAALSLVLLLVWFHGRSRVSVTAII